jgi:hypothetical protein
MYFKKIVLLTTLLALLITSLASMSFASKPDMRAEEEFALVDKPETVPVYGPIVVPEELTYGQIRTLKSGELVLGQVRMQEDGDVIASQLPSALRPVTNFFHSRSYTAYLVKKYTMGDAHPSTFIAEYEVPGWEDLNFTIVGFDEQLVDKNIIVDIDREAREAPPVCAVSLGYNSPMATHIRADAEELLIRSHHVMLHTLRQQMMLDEFELMDLQPEHSGGIKRAILNGGKYGVSFLLKPLLKKYVPGAEFVYPIAELAAKAKGYPTLTHVVTAPLTGEQKADQEVLHEGDFAISRSLGYIVSYVPGGSFLRAIATKAVNAKGYPTVTHYVRGHQDMSPEDAVRSRTPTQLAEDSVALSVGTFVPGGTILVLISQNTAWYLFGKTSMTAALIDKVRGKK